MKENRKIVIKIQNIVVFIVSGTLTGFLWAFLCPIPLVPGAIHFRTFSFLITAIGYIIGPISGFMSGYIGTLIWSILSNSIITIHTPFIDALLVGLLAALPVYILTISGK